MNRLLRIRFRQAHTDVNGVKVELQWSVYYHVKQRVTTRVEVPVTQHIEDVLL